MESQSHPNDIPIWWNGTQRWMTGLTKRTTCDDVIYALLYSSGLHETDSTDNYAIFEKWREVERPLSARTKLLKVWTFWDQEQANVKLSMRSLDDYFLPGESSLYVRSKRRHRRNSAHRSRHSNNERCVAKRSCVECSRLRSLEQLVKLVVSQERKIQELSDRIHRTDRQVDNHEARIHQHRVEQNGLDYVQNSYLNSHSSSSNSSIDSSTFTTIDLKKVKVIFPDSSWQELEEIIRMADDLTHIDQRLVSEQTKVKELTPEVNRMMEEMGLAEEQEQETNFELEDIKVQMVRMLTNHITNEYKEKELDRKSVVLQNHLEAKMEVLRELQNQLTEIDKEMNSTTDSCLSKNPGQYGVFDSDLTDSSNLVVNRSHEHQSHERRFGSSSLRHNDTNPHLDYLSGSNNHEPHCSAMGGKSKFDYHEYHDANSNPLVNGTNNDLPRESNDDHSKSLITSSGVNNAIRPSTSSHDLSRVTNDVTDMVPPSVVPHGSRNRGRLRDIKRSSGARSRSEERSRQATNTTNEHFRQGQARIAMGWDEEKGLRYSPAILNQYGLDSTNPVSSRKRVNANDAKHDALILPSPAETRLTLNEGKVRAVNFDERASETKSHNGPGGENSGRNAWRNKSGNCNQEGKASHIARMQNGTPGSLLDMLHTGSMHNISLPSQTHSSANHQDMETMSGKKAQSITLFEQSVTPSSAFVNDGMGLGTPVRMEHWGRNSTDVGMAPSDSRTQTLSNTSTTRHHRTIGKEEDIRCSNSPSANRISRERLKGGQSPLRIQEHNSILNDSNTLNPSFSSANASQTTQILSTNQTTSHRQQGGFIHNSPDFPLPRADQSKLDQHVIDNPRQNSNQFDHRKEISQMSDATSPWTSSVTKSRMSEVTANSRQEAPSSSHPSYSLVKPSQTPTHDIQHFTQSTFDNQRAPQTGHSGPLTYYSNGANHVDHSSTSMSYDSNENNSSTSSNSNNNYSSSLQINENNQVNSKTSNNYDSSSSFQDGKRDFSNNGPVEARKDEHSNRGALFHILSNKLNKSKSNDRSSGLYGFRNSSSLSMDNVRDFSNHTSESNTRNNLHYHSGGSCSSGSNATINASSSSTETLTQQTVNSSFNKDMSQVKSDTSLQSSRSGQNINSHRQHHQHANSYDGGFSRSGNRYGEAINYTRCNAQSINLQRNDQQPSGSPVQNPNSFPKDLGQNNSRKIAHSKSVPSSRSMDQIYGNAYDSDRGQPHMQYTNQLGQKESFISHGQLDKTPSGNSNGPYLPANQNSPALGDISTSKTHRQGDAGYPYPTTVSSPRVQIRNQNPPSDSSRPQSQQPKANFSSTESAPLPTTPGNRRRRVNPHFCDIDEKGKSVTDMRKSEVDFRNDQFNSENGFQKSTLVSGEEFGNRKVTFSNMNDVKGSKFINVSPSSSDPSVVDIRNIVSQRDSQKTGLKGMTTKNMNCYKESLSNGHSIVKSKLEDSNDSNSDTGLSSMHSDETANLETLV